MRAQLPRLPPFTEEGTEAHSLLSTMSRDSSTPAPCPHANPRPPIKFPRPFLLSPCFSPAAGELSCSCLCLRLAAGLWQLLGSVFSTSSKAFSFNRGPNLWSFIQFSDDTKEKGSSDLLVEAPFPQSFTPPSHSLPLSSEPSFQPTPQMESHGSNAPHPESS